MLFLIFRIKASLFCWTIITKSIQKSVEFEILYKFSVQNIASYFGWAFVMTLREAEMEGHRHCCPYVALMCPCCPIVNFKHSAHCSANSVCRHDLSPQRKHSLLYIISPWRKYSHISLWKEKNQHLSFHFSKCKLLLPLCLLNPWSRRHRRNYIWGGTINFKNAKDLQLFV